MPRPSKDQIRSAIRTALLQEVAEKGIGAVSMAAVAKRARVAPGTLYLHFDSKEQMLQALYLEIKTEFQAIMVAAQEEPSSRAMIRRMWKDMFDYVRANPQAFLFVEYAGAAQVLSPMQSSSIAHMQDEIRAMLQAAIDDGTLAPLPVRTVTVLLVAPAMHLARMALMTNEHPSQAEIDLTYERVWRSICAEGQ
ncbi:TetR/AcrR family transcriptional regulator [Ruegeria sp. 2205SS24-7]|uniref:TetR/AcrR family transcriptional regulator n=1 Tax=Ruegeria discodermiae TaxID=3064389 RepID=UPI00274056B8|nr:TetR/AcrR family transcriptional regulator [Ruegeria sp. 2205SS24-7]MDP5215886.1 TetR/AcrR family transcriptional regulator [Ruegeria sp. 2205SS24-7]